MSTSVLPFARLRLDRGAEGGDGQLPKPPHARPTAKPPLAEVRGLLHRRAALDGILIPVVPRLGGLLPHELLAELIASLFRESLGVVPALL